MGIQEDIYNLKKQGFDDNKIKLSLLQKGYQKQEVDASFPKEKIKGLWTIGVIALIMIIGLLFFNNLVINNDSQIIIDDGNSKIINIDEITNNTGFVDNQGFQVRNENISTVFDIYGYYKGNSFRNKYANDNATYMKINYNMTPSDGIIEGYVIFSIKENKEIYTLFVDNDWKNNVVPTNIWWGFSQSNKKEFNFTEVSSGIYMDEIVQDKKQDYNIHLNKLFLGDMTQEKIDSESNNMTFIIFE